MTIVERERLTWLPACLQLYANAVRKLPMMRNPWEHVIAIGLVSAC